MEEKSPVEKPVGAEEAKSFWKRHKFLVCAGAVLSIGIVFLGGWLFRAYVSPPPAPPPVREKNTVGFVNLQEAIVAHKDYPKLKQLREECVLLREEIAELRPLPRVSPPEVDEKPFDDSVWQKNAQNIIGQRAEIERQQKRASAEYREQTEEEYARQRDAIDAAYINAITNLRLKLENADVLHLGEDALHAMAEEMEQLQKERGERQQELWEQREADIEEHAREAVAGSLKELRAQAAAVREQFEAEAAKRQSEAQSRDIQAMEEQMEASQRFQKAVEKRRALEEKEQECAFLESHIFNDVAGKAAKLAILHHFTMIAANPAARLEALVPWPNRVGPAPERYAPVIASDVEDITEELVKELKDSL